MTDSRMDDREGSKKPSLSDRLAAIDRMLKNADEVTKRFEDEAARQEFKALMDELRKTRSYLAAFDKTDE